MKSEIKNLASDDIEVTEGLNDIRDAYKKRIGVGCSH